MPLKLLVWLASSLSDLKSFPVEARRIAGQELKLVQRGVDPSHWKPFSDVGSGVKEIIVDTQDGWFRVMYVAKFAEAIYVLHCFQKKSNSTSEQDKQLASSRYRQLIKERK